MKKFVVLIAWVIMIIVNAQAFDITLLANNKETLSRELTKQAASEAAQWGRNHNYNELELRSRSQKALTATFNEMVRIDTNCELGLVKRLKSDAKNFGVINHEDDTLKYVTYLRQQDLIDDLLYKMLKDSIALDKELVSNLHNRVSRPFNVYTRQNAGFDFANFYAPVKSWPDDINKCSTDAYYSMAQKLRWKTKEDLDFQMERLNYIAFISGTIDQETFNKLETFRNSEVVEWPIYFNRYADVINNAKDKMAKTREIKAENNFSSTYISRKEKITKRGNLYMTYNSTQIMMMAQLIEKTAKRMDSTRVTLNWQYTDDPNGETEVYIFSPMEQYRAAIKMLRKDMGEMMRSETFRGTGFQYEHLIAAAYETGYIKSAELDYVLKFEDFWNPKVPKWQTYANFAFSIAGSASFYLPPPWNILGAIGLVFAQAKVNGEPQPDPDDNWNVVI
jgi:hypothetical protein